MESVRALVLVVWPVMLVAVLLGVQGRAEADPVVKCTPWSAYLSDGTICVQREIKNTGPGGATQTVTVNYANGTSHTTTLAQGGSIIVNTHVTSVSIHETAVNGSSATFSVSTGSTTAPLKKCNDQIVYSSDGTVCVTYRVSNASTAGGGSISGSVSYASGSPAAFTLTQGQSTLISCFITQIKLHETIINNSIFELERL